MARRDASSSQGFLQDFDAMESRLFAIELRKLANSLSYGIDRSPFVGSGIDFAQARPYQEGDSIRQIDWRVTARTGRPHVKEYEAPKSMPCILLLDTSASMTVASGARSKYETMLWAAGGLALACLDRGTPVGIVTVGERALRVQPSLSRARVLEWILRLRSFRYDERTRLAARIAELAPSLTETSLVIVLSDMHEPEAVAALRRLDQRHDCVLGLLRDPLETGRLRSGFVRAREAETGAEFLAWGRRAWVDPDAVPRELRKSGIDHLVLRTDESLEAPLRELFRSRGRVGRGAR